MYIVPTILVYEAVQQEYVAKYLFHTAYNRYSKQSGLGFLFVSYMIYFRASLFL